MLKIWRRYWYWIGGILFIALSFFMGLWGSVHLEHIQVIMVFSFMAMLAHQVEEYGWPGGFPAVSNILQFGEVEGYERYPFNQNLSFFDNVFTTYTFYIVPIFFPNLIWLALAQSLAGFIQVLAHGIISPLRIKKIYNPGLFTALTLFLPIGIYMIYYTAIQGATVWDYTLGIVGAIVGYGIVFGIPVALMRNKNSKYPFASEEIYGAGDSWKKVITERMNKK
ncbi:HXXEE domain-containing protein [Tetragenococcus solitarius]|uniref:HXXEE domain-containing protein n=1 Tax=Tetragenococcus solitarius TaxID=71453 RepID=A0ABP6KK36_9ENTE|nr:HXXEE domain-containing protein [Tetragenococcus solitarius]